jgi:glycosyltransferase involved in cell wall biosynthesis
VPADPDGTSTPTAPSPTRVLWLIKGLGAGGAETLLLLWAKVRDRRRFVYEAAYVLPRKTALVEPMRESGVPVRCLNGGREWDVRWLLRLRRLLRQRRPHVVHVHSPYVAGFTRLVIRSLPRRDRPRLVTSEHLPWSGYAPATRMLNALTYRLDDAHVAVSHAVLTSIPSRLVDGTRVIRTGVDVAKIRGLRGERDGVRATLGVAPGEFVIGTIANFRVQKDYPTLLRAAARVVGSHPHVRFVVVGDGQLEHEIVRLRAELSLQESVLLLGRRDDPGRVLAACDAFVLASRFEGLPLALMEALAMALPVVATSSAGVRECVTDDEDALLVPVGDARALASALGRVIDEPDLRERLARGAGTAAERFDVVRMAHEIEALYRDMTDDGSRTREQAG